MRDYILIVLMPYETHPLHINFRIEFLSCYRRRALF
jgi:hypothetical protein